MTRWREFVGGFLSSAVGTAFGLSWWQALLVSFPTFIFTRLQADHENEVRK